MRRAKKCGEVKKCARMLFCSIIGKPVWAKATVVGEKGIKGNNCGIAHALAESRPAFFLAPFRLGTSIGVLAETSVGPPRGEQGSPVSSCLVTYSGATATSLGSCDPLLSLVQLHWESC